jgi:hypothetical protein
VISPEVPPILPAVCRHVTQQIAAHIAYASGQRTRWKHACRSSWHILFSTRL